MQNVVAFHVSDAEDVDFMGMVAADAAPLELYGHSVQSQVYPARKI